MSTYAVQMFLREYIDSYEALELLLLMQRERAAWTADALPTRLRVPIHLIDECLESFVRDGLVNLQSRDSTESYTYACSESTFGSAVCSLKRLYHLDPVQIMQLMSVNAVERMRTDALRAFTNAFIPRKGPGS